MREILFKAKRIGNGGWVEGIPIKTHLGLFISFEKIQIIAVSMDI